MKVVIGINCREHGQSSMAGNRQGFGKEISNFYHTRNEDDAELELLDAVP
jgi:hypothetical protein